MASNNLIIAVGALSVMLFVVLSIIFCPLLCNKRRKDRVVLVHAKPHELETF